MNEQHLIQKIGAGDKEAFTSLYEHFKSRVYNTCLSYLLQEEDAEEITQDVFVEIYYSSVHFRGDSSVSTWIYRIAVNKCLDALRYRSRKKRIHALISLFKKGSDELQIDVPHFHHPGVELENKERAMRLFAAIDTLAHPQKTAFILSYIEDLSQKEIAAVMKISEKAVESLIQRAKVKLRKELDEYKSERRK